MHALSSSLGRGLALGLARSAAAAAAVAGPAAIAGPTAAAAAGGAQQVRCYSPGYQPPSDDPIRAAFSYCINQVKQHDYETYLWCTQLPKELRAPILALRAFNVETALIADHAKSEMLMLMRCQWWRDAINSCYKGTPPDQPVVRALHQVMQQQPLTRYRLQRIVSVREEEMASQEPPPSLRALEEYGEGTAGQLLMLQMEAAGVEGEAAEYAALSLGKAVGITNLLRGTLHHAQQRGKTYLPADQCDALGVDQKDILKGAPSEGLNEVTRVVAADAKLRLEEARSVAGELPKAARLLLLPAVGVAMYLDALLAKDCNLLDPALMGGRPYTPLAYQLRLKWAVLRGAY